MDNRVIGFGFGILWLDIVLNIALLIVGAVLLLVSRKRNKGNIMPAAGAICVLVGIVGCIGQLVKIF